MSLKRKLYRSITLATLITEYRAHFPEVAARTIFVSDSGGNLTDTPDIAAQKSVDTLDMYGDIYGRLEKDDLRNKLQQTFTNAAPHATYFQATDLEIIIGLPAAGKKNTILYDRSLNAGYYASPVTKTRYDKWADPKNTFDLCFIFDHETGHSLTRALQDAKDIDTWHQYHNEHGNNRFECIADAYAVIRHIQRFGDKTGYPEFMIDFRARQALYDGGALHYTSRAIAAVLKIENIAALSPQQAIDMAVTIADNSLLSQAEGRELKEASEQINASKLMQQTSLEAPLYLAKKIAALKLPMAFECATIEMANLKELVPSYRTELKAAITEAHDCLLRRQKPDGALTKMAKKIFSDRQNLPVHPKARRKTPQLNMTRRI